MIADWEWAITGLANLRREWLTRGTAPNAFLVRRAAMEQTFVFLLIARCIRSEVPLSPTLAEMLERFLRRFTLNGTDYASHADQGAIAA